MCGIWLYLQLNGHTDRKELYSSFSNISHRGPDRHVFEDTGKIVFGYHRLAIMDTSVEGDQPFTFIEGNTKTYVMCNGEIYNFKELINIYNLEPKSNSDCEIIPLLYKKFKEKYKNPFEELLKSLKGCEYSLIIAEITYDKVKIMYARDPSGKRPLYHGYDEKGYIISSELKGVMNNSDELVKNCTQVEPRVAYCIEKNKDILKISSSPYWVFPNKYTITNKEEAINLIRETLIRCIKKRIYADREVAYLLSGGLDSSIVCAVAQSLSYKPIKTFCVGLPEATDEKYAKQVSEYIESEHTHIQVQEEDFLNVLEDIPYIVESWDTTTCRASTVQYIAGKSIKENTNAAVVIVGEGADELFGGYSYYHACPNSDEFGQETKNAIENIHYYDGQRADRCLSYCSLECRTPFLDDEFISLVLSIDPKLRMPYNGCEKNILREAFKDYLPENLLYRPKEAQSDGCSSKNKSWHKIIQDNINERYFDDINYEKDPPNTIEDKYFMSIYQNYYKNNFGIIPKRWLPKWCGNVKDPSARVLKTYNC